MHSVLRAPVVEARIVSLGANLLREQWLADLRLLPDASAACLCRIMLQADNLAHFCFASTRPNVATQ